ncbi:hypothetical protein [Cohnella lupini]|uniref:Uncharacterized protein n=1 Tax=Cohnella lupini TaxID=1294267 RepID=A0A3D9IML1_9BACL|nr:hypothetical protein [Cohnella lupini]RED63013.1 hypothetical protein DFP95_1046 [Cohnella lupini]
MIRSSIWTVLFVLLLTGGYLWTHKEEGVDSTLQSIIKNYVGADGRIYDPTNELGIKDIDNIGFAKKDDTLEITYGKLFFEVDVHTYEKINEVAEYLKPLGITIQFNNEGDVQLKYNGKPVKEYE